MRLFSLMALAALGGCGRLGFDQAPLAIEVTAGASTVDVRVCGGAARLWLTTQPLGAGWTAETLDDAIAALPAGAVAAERELPEAPCAIAAGLRVGPEQVPVYAYAATERRGTAAEATATMQPTWTREVTPQGDTVWVHRPEAMYRDPAAAAPALVFFHGWGHTTGVDDTSLTVDTMPRDSGFLELFGQDVPGAAPPRAPGLIDQPFLVLAPNCVDGGKLGAATLACWGWASSDVVYDETIAYARGRFAIDDHRVYATGLSTGGEGAFRLAITRASQIAAAVPIAATDLDLAWFDEHRCAATGVPIWAFHSRLDRNNPRTRFEHSIQLVDALNTCPPVEPAALSLGDWTFAGDGHAGWYEAYGDGHATANAGYTSIYPWLLAHAR